MASLRLKAGNIWYACIKLPGGKRTQVSTKKRDIGTAAERAANRRGAQLIADSLEELALGDPTETHIRKTLNHLFERVGNRARVSRPVDAYLSEWLQRVELHLAVSTHSRYKSIAESFLVGLGPRRSIALTEITVSDIQGWVDRQIGSGKRVSSVYAAWQTLGIPFAAALKQGLISVNPLPLADIPRFSRQPSRDPFSSTQIASIIRAATGDWRTAVLIGAFTGARIGDASRMRWQAVDLENAIIKYLPQKTRRTGIEIVMPIHPTLLDHLRNLRRLAPADAEYLCPSLIAGPRGKPVLSLQFKAILARAGISTEHVEDLADKAAGGPGRHKRPRYSFHSFRHSFASMLANAGVPQEQRKKLIGHTTDHAHAGYSHLALETMRGAVLRLPLFDADPKHDFQLHTAPIGCDGITKNPKQNPI